MLRKRDKRPKRRGASGVHGGRKRVFNPLAEPELAPPPPVLTKQAVLTFLRENAAHNTVGNDHRYPVRALAREANLSREHIWRVIQGSMRLTDKVHAMLSPVIDRIQRGELDLTAPALTPFEGRTPSQAIYPKFEQQVARKWPFV
jgi:hypothetical protein